MCEIINPDKIVGECLQTAFKIENYVYLIETARSDSFQADDAFRKQFNAYYRVRQRSKEWYDKYYKLMENQKKDKLTFGQILEIFFKDFNRVEASFTSKLLATIDTKQPIWDQYVLRNLRLDKEWASLNNKPAEQRIEGAVQLYQKINKRYEQFLDSDEGRKSVERFNEVLPEFSEKISKQKKVDFMLWGKRT